VHEALVEVALGRRRSAPELLEQLVRVEAPAVAHEGEALGDARRVGHFREDRRMQRAPVVIFVHGAWHGPWVWKAVIERLTVEGIRSVAVDLPSKGFETALLGDLHDDAETVRAAVDAAGGPALVVAHSYGGLPVSEGLADSANVAHLIYLAAFMLEPGQSLLGLRGGVEPEWWITSEDGRTLTPDDPEHVFYNDCSPEVAEAAAAALVPHRKDVFSQQLRAAAWQTVPSTYVICERDNAIPPAVQERMAEHAGTVSHIDAGHSPFLSRPHDVQAIIQETLAVVVAEAGA
jgi:pimeloyl-ACP methyl ester carboxylesterase